MATTPVQYAVIDAFTDKQFKGNPAAVCMLEEERDEEWMQGVASEFNISATAFLNPFVTAVASSGNPKFHLRWFTPITEIQPCGHGTIAASHFLFSSGLVTTDIIEFHTKVGLVTARRIDIFQQSDDKAEDFSIELDFPTIPVNHSNSSDILDSPSFPRTLNGASVLNKLELASGKAVADIQPQFDEIQNSNRNGLIITARADHGSKFDFFTRFFCPKLGINEDPVCGTVNCALAPYLSKKLGKRDLIAYMASSRGGRLELHVEENAERVQIRGKAVTIMIQALILFRGSFGHLVKSTEKMLQLIFKA